MRILVLGGTRFFGRRLVELLVNGGNEVWVGSRGNRPVPKGAKFVKLDRNEGLARSLADLGSWDVVYDQLGFTPDGMRALLNALAGRMGRLVFTSSGSVYPEGGTDIKESAFRPEEWESAESGEPSYPEGKRLAEKVVFAECEVPAVAVRLPIVLGPEDPTGRLIWHVDHARNGVPMRFPRLDVRVSFIASEDAARFLAWLARHPDLAGPVNAASADPVEIDDFLSLVGQAVGRPVVVTDDAEEISPFGIDDDFILDVTKAQNAGFQFSPLEGWLPKLLELVAVK